MFKLTPFVKRLLILSVLLNLPPIIAPVFMQIGLEPVLFIAWLAAWVNVPFLLGLEHLFGGQTMMFSEFGVKEAPMMVWLSIVVFWLLLAGILAGISLVFSRQASEAN